MGAWFLATFVFSIPALWFYAPVLHNTNYVLGAGEDTRVAIGAICEILLAISGIATAVVIFPIMKRVNESIALGHVACRVVESTIMLMGVVSLLSVVALRQDLAGTSGADGALVQVGRSLVAFHDQTLPLGPQFCAGCGNGNLLGYLMWRSRLLPRPMVMFGLIGGPLGFLGGLGVILGAWGTLRLPVRAHSSRDRLGVLAERVAAGQGLPTIAGPDRPGGDQQHFRLIRRGGRGARG